MRRALATLAIAAAGFAVAGCGKDNGSPIPQKDADALVKKIEQARRQADGSACVTLLNSTLPGLETQAQNLPSSVGSDVRSTITDAVNHLRDLATQECNNKQNQTTTDTTSSTSTSDTTPSTSDSTQSTSTSDSTPSTDTTQSTSTDSTQTTTPPTTDTNTDTGGGGVTPPTTTPTTPTSP
jgi:hypothetical protein